MGLTSIPAVESPSTQEGIMEIAIIPGLFVAIFALGAALILWFPYDAPKDRR